VYDNPEHKACNGEEQSGEKVLYRMVLCCNGQRAITERLQTDKPRDAPTPGFGILELPE